MKKTMKKIASIALAVAMVLSMAMPAMAGEITEGKKEYTISVNPTEKETESGEHTHKYVAYQIFEGVTATQNGEELLSDIKWGSGVTGTAGQKAVLAAFTAPNLGAEDPLYQESEFKDINELVDFLKDHNTEAAAAKAIAKALMKDKDANLVEEAGTSLNWQEEKGKYSATVESGYYLIVDSAAGVGDAISDYIVQVVSDTPINAKASSPTVEKKVEDDKDETAESGDGAGQQEDSGFYDTADHEINESFKFQLKATIPVNADLAAYESYMIAFRDTMSKGVEYEGNNTLTMTIKIDEGKTVKLDSNDIGKDGFTVTSSGGSTSNSGTSLNVTIEDLFKLAKDGIGDAIKKAFGVHQIEIEVTYSAHLTKDAKVVKPGVDDANTNTVILDYSNNPNVQGDGEPGHTPEETVYVFTYELPNKKVDEEEHPLTGAKFKLYGSETGKDEIKLEKNEDGTYSPIKDQINGSGIEMEPSEEEGTKGTFKLKGLDAGTYYLEETEAPTGYNKLTKRLKIEVKVTEHKKTDNGAETSYTVEADGITIIDEADNANGVNMIKNQKGATLPETGGMGTTIFYVVGSVLVLAAAVLLVTKRRMSAE